MRSVSGVLSLCLLFVCTAACHSQQVLHISRMVMAGQVLSSPIAVYPEDAKAGGIEGMVALDVVISKTGEVELAVPVAGPEKLRAAAADSVSKWRYQPYLLNGNAVAVSTQVVIEFRLKAGGVVRNASIDAVEIEADPTVRAATVPSATVAPSDPRPTNSLPVRVSGGIVDRQILHRKRPIFPEEAKRNNLGGKVVLHAVISKEGSIEKLMVVSGPVPLRQAALDAVQKWTYRHYVLAGQPVEGESTIEINFNVSPSRTSPLPMDASPLTPMSGPPH